MKITVENAPKYTIEMTHDEITALQAVMGSNCLNELKRALELLIRFERRHQ